MERMDVSHAASTSIQELQGLSGVTEEYSDKLDVRGKAYRYVPVPYRILYREADMFSCQLDRIYASRSILRSATPSKLMPTIRHGCSQPYMRNHVPAHSQAADPPPRTARGARDLPPGTTKHCPEPSTADPRWAAQRGSVTPRSYCTPRTRDAPGHP
ncbi:hypothetical protein B0H11DRAFT_2089637 [Mycena galericulata]|nr:hypothetical protein B0H11DRAFT_2089637 [Mycena galericulata]